MSVRSGRLPTVRFTTNLFQYESLTEYLSKQHDYVRRTIGDIHTLEDLSAKEPELRKRHSVAIPTLLRSKARFEINDTADGIEASITVPFQGDARLFSVKPDNAGHRGIGPYATVDDASWSDREPAISLDKTFASGTTANDVKIWAKSEIDTIEAWLSDMAPELHAYNGTIDEFIDSLIEQRRAVLATAESFRAELEDGI
jgi:hypothetical protein